MPLTIEPAFTVGRADSGRDLATAASAQVAVVIAAGTPAVICAHRENLLSLVAAACAALGTTVPEGDPLPMAGFWVLHAAHGLLAAAEQHGPAGP
jgi:hypothetical protein